MGIRSVRCVEATRRIPPPSMYGIFSKLVVGKCLYTSHADDGCILLVLPVQEAGLADVTNAWEDVKDFKWHRNQQSPNWSVIPPADRESDPLTKATPN